MVYAPTTLRLHSVDQRAARLAEMVVGLTDCEPARALAAIRAYQNDPDGLAVVARAVVSMERTERTERTKTATVAPADDVVDLRARRPHAHVHSPDRFDGR